MRNSSLICDICKSYSTTKGITLFRFPKNAIQRAKWVDFVNKPNWQPNTSSLIKSQIKLNIIYFFSMGIQTKKFILTKGGRQKNPECSEMDNFKQGDQKNCFNKKNDSRLAEYFFTFCMKKVYFLLANFINPHRSPVHLSSVI